jgi:hypothetical protein
MRTRKRGEEKGEKNTFVKEFFAKTMKGNKNRASQKRMQVYK